MKCFKIKTLGTAILVLFLAFFLQPRNAASACVDGDSSNPEYAEAAGFALGCALACIFGGCPEQCTNQTCDSIVVNTSNSCTAVAWCVKGFCPLKEAWNKAKTCSTAQTITFDTTDPAPKITSSIDDQIFTLDGNAQPITIDGGASRFTFDGKTTKFTAFTVKGPNITLKNLFLKDYKGPTIKVDATATNFNLINTTVTAASGVAVADALDSSGANTSGNNVPLFIRPYSQAGQYVAYVALPIDSEIHFYKTSGGTFVDLVGTEINLTPESGSSGLETSQLKDPSGNAVDPGSMTIVGGMLNGFSPNDKLIALVKNKDKNITLVRAGLPPLFFQDGDNDFLCDFCETTWFGTDPTKADTDGNNTPDYSQVIPSTHVPHAVKEGDHYRFVAGNYVQNIQPAGGPTTTQPPPAESGGSCSLSSHPTYRPNLFYVFIFFMLVISLRLRFSKTKN